MQHKGKHVTAFDFQRNDFTLEPTKQCSVVQSARTSVLQTGQTVKPVEATVSDHRRQEVSLIPMNVSHTMRDR